MLTTAPSVAHLSVGSLLSVCLSPTVDLPVSAPSATVSSPSSVFQYVSVVWRSTKQLEDLVQAHKNIKL